VVSFTPRLLYPGGNGFRYPLDRRLGGRQSRSGRCGEEKIVVMPGIEPGLSSPSLYRLSYPGSYLLLLLLLLLRLRISVTSVPTSLPPFEWTPYICISFGVWRRRHSDIPPLFILFKCIYPLKPNGFYMYHLL
jgi:hypothetical protein